MMAFLTGSSPLAVLKWPIWIFDSFYGQVPWLWAYIRDQLAQVTALPHMKEKDQKSFWFNINRAYDPRTNQQRWDSAPENAKRVMEARRRR